MTTVAFIAARMGSTRFPGKVMKLLGGVPMLEWVVTAGLVADDTWVCTTTEPRDEAISDWCKSRGYSCFRGSEDDVLKRFADCARALDLKRDDLVIRLTGDCPFLDPRIIEEVEALQRQTGCSFANNTDPATYPDGLDVEVITVEALLEADASATRLTDRNTVVQYISRHRTRYPSRTLICPIPGLANERWVVDTLDDFRWAEVMVEEVARYGKGPDLISMLDIIRREPALRRTGIRNERFFAAIASQQEKSV